MSRGQPHPLFVTFLDNGRTFKTSDQWANYVAALEELNLERVADSGLEMHEGDPIVSKSQPPFERRRHFKPHGVYWLKRTANVHDKRQALERAAEHLGRLIEVRTRYAAADIAAIEQDLLR